MAFLVDCVSSHAPYDLSFDGKYGAYCNRKRCAISRKQSRSKSLTIVLSDCTNNRTDQRAKERGRYVLAEPNMSIESLPLRYIGNLKDGTKKLKYCNQIDDDVGMAWLTHRRVHFTHRNSRKRRERDPFTWQPTPTQAHPHWHTQQVVAAVHRMRTQCATTRPAMRSLLRIKYTVHVRRRETILFARFRALSLSRVAIRKRERANLSH